MRKLVVEYNDIVMSLLSPGDSSLLLTLGSVFDFLPSLELALFCLSICLCSCSE